MEEEMKDWMPACSIGRKMVDSAFCGLSTRKRANQISSESEQSMYQYGIVHKTSQSTTQ